MKHEQEVEAKVWAKGPSGVPTAALSGLATLVLSAVACATVEAHAPLASARQVGEPWASLCPPLVGGADLVLEPRDRGLALTMTAGQKAEDVYERLRRLGSEVGAAGSAGKEGTLSSAPKVDPDEWLPAARVTVVSVAGGGKALFEAREPGESELLRKRLTDLLTRMRVGGCVVVPRQPPERRAPAQERPMDSGHHH